MENVSYNLVDGVSIGVFFSYSNAVVNSGVFSCFQTVLSNAVNVLKLVLFTSNIFSNCIVVGGSEAGFCLEMLVRSFN